MEKAVNGLVEDDLEQHMGRIASRMRQKADMFPWDGRAGSGAEILARHCHRDKKTGASIIFTLDFGYHACGWWKNPDYDRCYHLSLASMGLALGKQLPQSVLSDIPDLTQKSREAWCKAFFAENCRLLWIEPPHTPEGKCHETYHYRLFIDESGVPLLPRGEVYSRELTEAGWKSWSDLHKV
ncbi:MAG: hypothetical protein ACYS7Y_15990 [Planctomycetota bacterium]|jgi:hypothetical protein